MSIRLKPAIVSSKDKQRHSEAVKKKKHKEECGVFWDLVDQIVIERKSEFNRRVNESKLENRKQLHMKNTEKKNGN